MKYSGSLYAVKDIDIAVAFYQELFGMEILHDYGKCKTFVGGLTLQQDFDWLTGIPAGEIRQRANNGELFFEATDFDGFVAKLKARIDVELLHDVMTHTWGQRVIRFYDPDKHLIEVGEAMKTVLERFLSQGMSREEIALTMDVASAEIDKMLE